MLTVAVTGASGFIGRAASTELRAAGHRVREVLRRAPSDTREAFIVPDIGPDTDWRRVLDGVDVVVHCAAKTADSRRRAVSSVDAVHRLNVEGTEQLARAAAASGVRRIVFLSSVKAIAANADSRGPLKSSAEPRPADAYGRSKLEAERALHQVSTQLGLESVVIRPPLVYGPGVRGNFFTLMKAVSTGIPLPVGGTANRRSYVGIRNLTSLVRACSEKEEAAGRTFHVSDGFDVATEDLLRMIGDALGRRPRIITFPRSVLVAAGTVLRVRPRLESLLGSLQVDISEARERLNWTPTVTMHEQVRETVESFQATQRGQH